jgi:hypothetical protein
MGLRLARLGIGLALAACVAAGTASAKTEPTKKPAPRLRLAHSWASAMAEAKDRGCVVFASFHEDG